MKIMKKLFKFAPVLIAVALMGQGCIIQFNNAGTTDGGVWRSGNKGTDWVQKNAVLSVGGARTMADQLNRQGGLLGYTVKVIAIDDQADSDVAAEKAQEIASAIKQGKKVIGVIGHLNSSCQTLLNQW